MKSVNLKKLIVIIIIIALVAGITLNLTGCDDNRQIIPSDIQFSTPEVLYIGNQGVTQLDISKMLKIESEDVTYSVNNDRATVNGNILTVVSKGKIEITFNQDGKSRKQECEIIDGYNVTTYEELKAATDDKKVVLVQDDIVFVKNTDEDRAGNIMLYDDLYGNGHTFDCSEAVNTANEVMIAPSAENVNIRDIHMFGKKVDKDESLELESLITYGILILWEAEAGVEVSGSLKYSHLENAHKIVGINNADVTIEGCLLQNSSDAIVAIHSVNCGKSNIVMENNVLSNGFVSAILFYSLQNVSCDSKFPTLTIKGFLDIYNWRSTSNVKLIPVTEGSFVANTGNKIIAQEAQKEQYKADFYDYKDEYYVHCAIFIICQPKKGLNGTGLNAPKIYYEDKEITLVEQGEKAPENDLKFERRTFPMPRAATQFIAMVEFIAHYQDAVIEPDDEIPGNIFDKLRDD